MIKRLKINGYKSIDKVDIKFKNLNLLVGGNSSGKSTIIQSLLLFSQGCTSFRDTFGDLISFDDFREIRNYKTNPKKIEMDLYFEDIHCKKEIYESEDGNIVLKKRCIDCEIGFTFENYFDKCQKNLEHNVSFHYLSSDRIGSQDIYKKQIGENCKVGINGEYTIAYFEKSKNEQLYEKLIKNKSDKTLAGQVNYWLNYILGYGLATEKIRQTDFFKGIYIKNGFEFRGRNVGAGLGYLVSILVLCLSAKERNIVLIENPEIHLHPKAQSLLTEFFIFISNAGVQIILETHSDHIFNGIRVGVHKKSIEKNDVSINFFSLNKEYVTQHCEIEINEEGTILNPTADLFEQFDLDLNELLDL
ncbi:hypothetical protein FV113G1_22010 [Fusobacterium varium]|nr:hypothetical protein FV113G1_22010 [Fusobacterium varium]